MRFGTKVGSADTSKALRPKFKVVWSRAMKTKLERVDWLYSLASIELTLVPRNIRIEES
jgi:hypothetical protein